APTAARRSRPKRRGASRARSATRRWSSEPCRAFAPSSRSRRTRPFSKRSPPTPTAGALRLNTVMPVKGPLGETLERLAALGPPLWVDLKGRQLRVVAAALPPFTEVRVSHAVRVPVPADAFFSDGREYARVV